MQKRLVAILVFSLFKTILSYTAARVVDPFSFALEQFLSDITFEIVPYPTYPNPSCGQYPPPYPIDAYYPLDGLYQCGKYQDYSNIYCPLESEIPYTQYPNFLDIPYGIDTYNYPACSCSCYQDIREPCIMYDDPCVPLYICFEGFENAETAPYIYFPQVEYPMSAMDIQPYYYGNCWCT